MIAITICGIVCGLGVFVVIRPGVLSSRAKLVHEQFEQGMVWLVRRSQDRHRADLAVVGHQASEMVIKKLTSLFVGVLAGFALNIFLSNWRQYLKINWRRNFNQHWCHGFLSAR